MLFYGLEVYTLYHATYGAYVESIKKMGGLVPNINQNWDISKKGVIYLCTDVVTAVDFCQTANMVSEEMLDDVIAYEIDIEKLDINKLQVDENFPPDEQNGIWCFTYDGIIPSDLLEETDFI